MPIRVLKLEVDFLPRGALTTCTVRSPSQRMPTLNSVFLSARERYSRTKLRKTFLGGDKPSLQVKYAPVCASPVFLALESGNRAGSFFVFLVERGGSTGATRRFDTPPPPRFAL